VADGAPGPITRRLIDLYWQKHQDPAWSTPVEDVSARNAPEP
jgi:branched-chain amino acid aminotransferase